MGPQFPCVGNDGSPGRKSCLSDSDLPVIVTIIVTNRPSSAVPGGANRTRAVWQSCRVSLSQVICRGLVEVIGRQRSSRELHLISTQISFQRSTHGLLVRQFVTMPWNRVTTDASSGCVRSLCRARPVVAADLMRPRASARGRSPALVGDSFSRFASMGADWRSWVLLQRW